MPVIIKSQCAVELKVLLFPSAEPSVNILINNAGVMHCPKMTTNDGFEMQFGVNHLGKLFFTLVY